MEQWEAAPFFSRYFVSNRGRIRNKAGTFLNTTPKKGYIRVTMVDDHNQKKNVRVHRLVCKAFVENLDNKLTVNHVDHNIWNNTAENLQWATVSEQNRHKRKSTMKYENIETSPFDVWIEIPSDIVSGIQGYYISPSGKIKNKKGHIFNGNNKDGYLWVNIVNKSYQLHVLMAKVFLPNVYAKPYVNHKDGNKENAKLSNLEWCTPSENTQHALENDLLPFCKQIQVCDVLENSIRTYHSIREAERCLKISHKTITKYLEQHRTYKRKYIFKVNT